MQSCLPGEPLPKPPGNGTGGSHVAPLQDGRRRPGHSREGGPALLGRADTRGKPADVFPRQIIPVPSGGRGGEEKSPCKNPSKGPNTLYYKP